jgi:hypothetical protein
MNRGHPPPISSQASQAPRATRHRTCKPRGSGARGARARGSGLGAVPAQVQSPSRELPSPPRAESRGTRGPEPRGPGPGPPPGPSGDWALNQRPPPPPTTNNQTTTNKQQRKEQGGSYKLPAPQAPQLVGRGAWGWPGRRWRYALLRRCALLRCAAGCAKLCAHCVAAGGQLRAN